MRISLGVEYDGSGFSGWEVQPAGRTVQAALERALSIVADHRVKTVCAGRTDAGVHALGQVVHFDPEGERSPRAWVFGANANLPHSVSVVWAQAVETDFHARFSARSRHYRYLILNRPVRPALLSRRVTWECRPLSEERMRAAAGYLIGEHDFTSYRSVACQAKNPVRNLHRLEVARAGDLIRVDVVANAFLHHMVRNIAGVLLAVGMGKREPAWAREVLQARDRTQGGMTARPDGLYLMGADYPEHFRIPRVFPSPVVW